MYKTLLIGLGQIGMGYDFNLSMEDYILSHAQAIKKHPSFKLICAIDPSIIKRKTFENKFNVTALSSLKELKSIDYFDVIVIAVPTRFHLKVFKDIVKRFSPKLILIEKPLSNSLKESNRIVELSKEVNIPLAVNYFRAFDPFHQKLLKKIKNNELGFPLKILCWYCKGIINNGSHFIQLFSNFLGNVRSSNIIKYRDSVLHNDFEPTAIINYEKGEVIFIPVEEKNYSLFEMEIIGNKGKIKYYNSGSSYECWEVVDDSIFKGNLKLSSKSKVFKTNMNKYQYNVYDNIDQFLQKRSTLFCSGEDALEVSKVIDNLSMNEEKRKSDEK